MIQIKFLKLKANTSLEREYTWDMKQYVEFAGKYVLLQRSLHSEHL